MNANELFNAVTQLDLTQIKTKLMHVQSGEGWSQEKADGVEKEYRRFLCLMKVFPEEHIAPLMDVDIFWHYHILDTMKYAVDCEQVFGYFQHHYPYVGIEGGEEGQQLRLDSGDRMRELYEMTFGEPYPGWIYENVPAIAFSAGPIPPHDQPGVRAADGSNAIAFSAGPIPPHDQPGVRAATGSNAIAFSAGPIPPHDQPGARAAGSANAIAFSAGPVPPHDRSGARAAGSANAIAFSAGPVPPHDRSGARAAGSANAIAFSAGPVPPHTRLNPLVKDIAGAIVSRSGPAAIPRPVPVLPG